MAEITWTRESELWLKDIFDYIAVDDPGAAGRTVIAILEKAQLLRNHPRLGHKYEIVESREVRILLRALPNYVSHKARWQHRYSRRLSRCLRHRSISYLIESTA